MIQALLVLILLVCLVLGAAGGAALGYRRGMVTGRNDTVRRLILAKDQECWVAAHYLEADTFAEAKTERISRRRAGELANPTG